MKTRLLLIALITAIAGMGTSLAACSSDDDSNNGGGGDAGKDSTPQNDSGGDPAATFTEVYQIFTQRCAGCHVNPRADGGAPSGALVLVPSKDAAYNNLVNKVSPGGPCKTGDAGTADLKLITPGDAENSLLYTKVRLDKNNVVPCGGHMPLGAAGPLTQAQVDTIESWIEDGAQNN